MIFFGQVKGLFEIAEFCGVLFYINFFVETKPLRKNFCPSDLCSSIASLILLSVYNNRVGSGFRAFFSMLKVHVISQVVVGTISN